MQISGIPRLAERLGCMIYRRKFEMDLEELRPEMNLLRGAHDELRSSVPFRRVLAIVLALGNALNGGSFRGGATGFQLDALLKLRDTRTTAGIGSGAPPTLLHYLVRTLERESADLVDFATEMVHLDAASRVSLNAVLATTTSLSGGLELVRDEVDRALRSAPAAADRFVPAMEAFVQQARPAIDALQTATAQLDADLRALLVYLGEDPAQGAKPEDLFGTVVQFANALHRAADELREDDKRRERIAGGPKRPIVVVGGPEVGKAWRSSPARGKLDVPPAPPSTPGKTPSLGRHAVDDALRDLRSGGSLLRRQRGTPSARPLCVCRSPGSWTEAVQIKSFSRSLSASHLCRSLPSHAV